ncbi:MAG: DUF3365 domain-containing protein [Caldimicrobium sp.]|nr:DUF3365 domain-containing protein [Caldimicrobium sp.]MCX7613934.1 DUF3365 domain-containing protein [Caldimicrobium sp.]MDW8182017.1 DUF3365 domain-containing protein [Caldimicrobium sp.]
MLQSLKLKITRRFLIYLNLLLFLFLFFPFFFLFNYLEKIFTEQIKKQALTVYHQIVLTRKWIADHGGIFVEKLPWVEENPYLKKVGEITKIYTREGGVLIKENPALVTRQLSELARENKLYWFKITSQKYINPANAPDQLEKEALVIFEKNKNLEEFTKIVSIEGQLFFRLIKPLFTEKPCLRCHAHQGYKEGDIRGAISIFVPFEETYKKIVSYKFYTLLSFVIFWLVLNLMVLAISNKFIFNPLYCIINLLSKLRYLYGSASNPKATKSEIIVPNEWSILLDSINNFLKEINYYQDQMELKIKQATQELETQTKLLQKLLDHKSFLLSNMAHEIKTPLTSIKGSIDFIYHYFIGRKLASLSEADKERLEEFLMICQKNISRLIHLFNTLVDLEKHEANLLELDLQSFSIKNLIEEVLYSLKGLSDPKAIRFHLDVEENLKIVGDYEKLLVVISNLLSNAIKYSPPDGTIFIRAFRRNSFIRVEIQDQGEGITSEEAEKIFVKFYKKGEKGFGLGLTIAKAYVEAHEGTIGTIPCDRGACFYFEIPQKDL